MKWYLINLFCAFDQLINALFGGWCDETMSSHAFRLWRDKKPFGWLMRVYIFDNSLPQCSMVGVGCWRLLEVDYDHTTWVVTDGLYGQYCARGYRCEWLRKPAGWRPQSETSSMVVDE